MGNNLRGMNKNKSRQSFSNCNLVQTDIFTAFNKWKDSSRKKIKKTSSKMYFTSSVIINVDSDSEQTVEDANEVIKVSVKRKLPLPFSDDEDEEENKDTQSENSGGSNKITTPSTPRKITQIAVNKPMACSTPHALSESSINRTHVGIGDLSTILNKECDTMSEAGSVNGTNTERTITEFSVSKTNTKIGVIENLVIPPPSRTEQNIRPTQQIDTNRIINKPTRKRVSETERAYKQQKVDIGNKKQSTEKISRKSKENKGGQSVDNKCDDKSKQILNRNDQSATSALSKKSIGGKLQENLAQSTKRGSKSIKNKVKRKLGSSEIQNDRNEEQPSTPSVKKVNYSNDITRSLSDDSGEQNQVITAHNNKDFTQKSTTNLKRNESSEKPTKTVNKESKSEVWLSKTSPHKDIPRQPLNSSSLIKSKKTNVQSTNKSRQSSEDTQSTNKETLSNNNIAQPGCSKRPKEINDSGNKSFNNVQNTDRSVCSSKDLDRQTLHGRLSLKAKKEGKKINVEYLKVITELFITVYETKYLKNLVVSDKEKLKIFFQMKKEYQYVCLKLFTWQRRWYNVFKFCELVNVNIADSDVCDLYNLFKEKQIVDTDYTKDDVIKLLNLLDRNDLKNICDKFKLNKSLTTRKEDMINGLLRYCRTQSTLTSEKSTQDLIKEEIIRKMGKCIRLNKNFHDAFYRTYVLGTFTNPAFANMTDYFKNMLHLKILFPTYPVHDYLVFYSQEEFIRFVRAKQCRDELDKYMGNHLESLRICKTMFEELVALKDIEDQSDNRYQDAPHLIRFTARAVYVSGLSSAIKILATKFPNEVKEWLEYMIENETKFVHRLGEWYYHLSWLYMKYLEPHNYEHAAKLIIEVLQQKREHLSEVQLHQLGKRGELLKVTKKYKIDQWYHDTIAELVPKPIDVDKEIPQHTTDAKTIRGNESGRKRGYVVQDKDGNKRFLSVEAIALEHYIEEQGYIDGRHCEGSLIKATFILFFWDIVYQMEVPGSFISKIQNEPLDMNTKYFYLKRKDAIDKRLKEIESEWSHSEIVKRLKDNYDLHSHELGFCEVGKTIEHPDLLEILVDCIGRRVLAKIYERLVKNIRHYRSGMPDLLVWNPDKKKSKFVEVKGENDKLSIGQTLWLKYLQTIGADAEVCHVHSMGSKRKVIKKAKNKDLAVPSTSSSSN